MRSGFRVTELERAVRYPVYPNVWVGVGGRADPASSSKQQALMTRKGCNSVFRVHGPVASGAVVGSGRNTFEIPLHTESHSDRSLSPQWAFKGGMADWLKVVRTSSGPKMGGTKPKVGNGAQGSGTGGGK